MQSFQILTEKPSPYGETVEIAEGPRDFGEGRSIYLSDEAYSFVEPILRRHAADYHPDTRWGIGEVQAIAWRPAIGDLRALAARLEKGRPSSADVAWVHTVCVDDDTEIDTAAFVARFDDIQSLAALRGLLVALADWLEDSLRRFDVLTISGY